MEADITKSLLRYLITGGTAAVVDIGGFSLLSRAPVSVALAAGCSFCVAAAVNFLLSSRWAFFTRPTGSRFVAFLSGALFGLLINVAMTHIAVVYMEIPKVLAKTLAIGTTFLLNFWINVSIVFREQSI